MTALMVFNIGPFMIYTGQEAEANLTPILFKIDKVRWGERSLTAYLIRLAKLKKNAAQASGVFVV